MMRGRCRLSGATLEDSIAKPEPKPNWIPTPKTFRQFLDWLDQSVDSSGETYLELRRRLVAYFERKRCLAPGDLADETLTRVMRRLSDEGTIRGVVPAQYCYIIGRFVFLEYLRRADEVPASDLLAAPEPDPGGERTETRMACLDGCLGRLAPDERELILDYYRGDQRVKIEGRRALADRMRISQNALTIRACRIRDRLETCVTACCARPDMFS